MYTPYNRNIASAEDRVAWALCQIMDDDAPLRWTRYRGAAACIATNPEVMADLDQLKLDLIPPTKTTKPSVDAMRLLDEAAPPEVPRQENLRR